MYDGGKIIVGLIIGVGLLLSPFIYDAGKAAKAPEPELTEKAKEAGACVAPTPYMQEYHMQLLEYWRDTVVRDGDRYYNTSEKNWQLQVLDALGQLEKGEEFYEAEKEKVYYKSLQVTCLDCHSNKSKFCDKCHDYIGFDPYCWDCHIEPEEDEEIE